MYGSCRFCSQPTDKWQDFCNECATTEAPRPRFRVIRGGKTDWERPGREKKTGNRWLTPVAAPRTLPPEV